MRHNCACDSTKMGRGDCECNASEHPPRSRRNNRVTTNVSASVTRARINRSTCPLTARRNSILLFSSSLLILLSGSSEALANSFCSYSPISNTNTFNSNYLLFPTITTKTSTNLNNSRRNSSNSYRPFNGWISRTRSPLLLSFRGGSLQPVSSNINGKNRNESSDEDQSQPPSQQQKQQTQQQQKELRQSNGVIVESQTQIFAAATAVPEDQHHPCSYIAEAELPTDVGNFRLRAYRITDNDGGAGGGMQKNKWLGTEPCLIYCKDKPLFGGDGKDVPIRIHDQCFTSEVFRSKRCDCKEQLKLSLEYIRNNGGAIIYLQQEGRGIGLANKVAAYELQDMGLDTVDANIQLGYPEDCRQYGVVPSILHDMGISTIRLITNNPRKIDRLRALGIDVVGTIPMVVERPNPYNRKYLQTKMDRMNHSNFVDLLAMDNAEPSDSLTNTDSASADDAVNVAMNGMMQPRRKPVEENAAAAIKAALTDTDNIPPPGLTKESHQQLGVTASADGYCMGRQSVEDAIAAVARGEIVVVVDDMDRENEGDFIMAADLATPEAIATIVRYSSGVICVGMEGETMDRLKLPPMLVNNEDPKGTAFSVTVDGAPEHGITTGISAGERALTIRLLASESTQPIDLRRPGHIFPLRAQEGGVLTRDGHTEAAVDLARLAGCHPSGVLCEIVSEENPTEMARLPECAKMCRENGWVMTSIVDIAQYRRDVEGL